MHSKQASTPTQPDSIPAIPVLCVIGTGLIGGSLSLALKQQNYCGRIIGAGRSEATLQRAKQLAIIDDYDTSIAAAVAQADMVFVSVPLGAMSAVFEQIKPALKADAVVTDAGSAKQQVVNLAEKIFAEHSQRFVAGHPIAGTENSGPAAAFAELYQQRRVILTPTTHTLASALEQVTAMWQATGATVERMDATHHDKVLAATSHLPHAIAFALVDCLASMDDIDEIFRFAAGGFRDISRIASSDPVMWRDTFMQNREQILEMIQRYQAELDIIYQALQSSDAASLQALFTRAKKSRDQFV